MNELGTLDNPVIIPESIVVHPDGELRRGLYYYVVTAVGEKESTPSHLLQVYAPNKENSIEFEWNKVLGVDEYRVYRGTILGKYDGYFSIYKSLDGCYFIDNGFGELNQNVCEDAY